MFKAKIKHNYQNILTAAILILLVATQIFAVAHKFSHHSAANIEITQDQPTKQHNDHACVWCFSSNLQNQILLTASFIFLAAYFYLTFFTRNFNRVKASYLLSSKSPRAPPLNS